MKTPDLPFGESGVLHARKTKETLIQSQNQRFPRNYTKRISSRFPSPCAILASVAMEGIDCPFSMRLILGKR